MHVWALGLSCETPAFKNTTKIQREDTQRDTKERNGGGKGKKKARNFGLPTLRGPTLSGPHFSGFYPSGLHPSGLHPLGLHPSGPHPLWSQNSTSKNWPKSQLGRSRNWPKSIALSGGGGVRRRGLEHTHHHTHTQQQHRTLTYTKTNHNTTTRKMDWPKMDWPKIGLAKVGHYSQNFALFFFRLPPQNSLFFFPLFWSFSLNFGGVFEGRGPKCAR